MTFLGAGLLNSACGHVRFDGGLWNPCLGSPLPARLAAHDLVLSAWDSLDMRQVWDCHVHLVGSGDSDSGIWVNSDMQSLLHPVQYLQWKFYMNATCLEKSASVDEDFVRQLVDLHDDFPKGFRCMLLAFDYQYDEHGNRLLAESGFHVPDHYAASIAKHHPARFEWIASIHPYRQDCVSALDNARALGARAVKWLPPVMGIDPASPLCDRFYEALVKYDMPLLCHAGREMAVKSGENTELGNPLLLRRALDHGVRVIVAHCGSLGENIDLDRGPDAAKVPSFSLFARLMDDSRYERLLFGDISALVQVNRVGAALNTVLQRTDWHHRLINGSDYPLPGVVPLISMAQLAEGNYISVEQAAVLTEIRQYNPLLFDFVLKRHIRFQGKRLSKGIFQSRRLFA